MRKYLVISIFLGTLLTSKLPLQAHASPAPQTNEKEWTFLIYLNGNNNLDSFGTVNIKQMEKAGSTNAINVVTQWASLERSKVERLYITQSNQSQKVTSPVVEDLGNIDMGDWHNLVDFIHWGVKNYPAKHYFIDVWDHGSGWRILQANRNRASRFRPMDISWDDNTGNSISTSQLGKALADAAKFIGHKVDLYASDACLMGMVEIAQEVSESVNVYAGSEEVEAAAGWPYDTFLARWSLHPQSTPQQVATFLTEEYISSYSGGENGTADATFAAYDLNKLSPVTKAISSLGTELSKLPQQAQARIIGAAKDTQNFSYSDYGDLTDFISLLEKESLLDSSKSNASNLKHALDEFILSHGATPSYSRALGLSIWLPTSKGSFDAYSGKYAQLKFQNETHWGNALRSLLKN